MILLAPASRSSCDIQLPSVWKMEELFHDGDLIVDESDAHYTGEKMSFTVVIKEEMVVTPSQPL